MRATFLPFARPDVGADELDEVREVLESGWLTTGPKAARFESEFAARVGAPHAVAVASGTAALHLALVALDVGRDDVVLTTPYTFAATAEAVRYLDARPLFVDVEPDTLNLSPAALDDAAARARRVHGDRLRAVIAVHLAGHPCDMDGLTAVAGRHGLAVVEDAAHAFPATYRGRPVGTAEASVACFSFYATKALTTGEGGMITTADAAVAERCRMLTLHGIDRDVWRRGGSRASWRYEVVAPGYKANLPDLAAALGLAQLRRADLMWKRRSQIAARYAEAFAAEAALDPPVARPDVEHAWQLYLLRLRAGARAGGSDPEQARDAFVEALARRNIGASVHFKPLHLHRYYRERHGCRPGDCPVAEREWRREVSLPLYSRMTDSDVRDVIRAVGDVVHGRA